VSNLDILSLLLGSVTAYGLFPPHKLKAGLQHLGSNLTDREFEYLLQKVGKSHDGKISLSEFDRIINSAAVDYDERHSQAQRDRRREKEREAVSHPLPLPSDHNSKYSRSYDSFDLIGTLGIPEFDLLSSGKTGRMAGAVWDNLRRLMQSKSDSLPAAFNNIAQCLNPHVHTHTPNANMAHERFNMGDLNQDSRGEKSGSGLVSGSGLESCLKISRSLDGTETKARSRVSHMASHGSLSIELVTGQHSESNSNSSSSSSNSISGSRGKKVRRGSAGVAQSAACIPISQIRNFLSDSGVQLGTEDATRLYSMLVRRLSETHPTHTQTQTQGEDREGDLLITLDQFCDIVGIPLDGQTTAHMRGHSMRSLFQSHKYC
jgi:hypothetical protein